MDFKQSSCKPFKVVFIGNYGVGKTSLLKQYIFNKFYTVQKQTIGGDDIFMKKIKVDDNLEVLLQIWDTHGAERHWAMGAGYYRGAKGCFLVFDICDLTSFELLNHWKGDFLEGGEIENTENFPFIVLGNKVDKEQEGCRQVSKEKAEKWCKENGMVYLETNAKDINNVNEIFVKMASLVAESIKRTTPAEESVVQPTVTNLHYYCNIV